MTYKEFFIEQYKSAYPERPITYNIGKRQEIIIKDYTFPEVIIEITDKIDFNFSKFTLVDFSALSTYLFVRMRYPDTRFFFNKNQINIYLDKVFTKDKKGEFEKAMYMFNLIDYISLQIQTIVLSLYQ